MTEDEAKTKWCPIAGLAGAVFFANPERTMTPPDDAGRNCIGSACMMWKSTTFTGYSWPEPPNDLPIFFSDESSGYCGLAAKP